MISLRLIDEGFEEKGGTGVKNKINAIKKEYKKISERAGQVCVASSNLASGLQLYLAFYTRAR